MSREIKFRAWCEPWHQMGYQHDQGKIFVFKTHNELPERVFKDKIFKIMQYTGLKDGEGKEIYEKDIVECTHWFFDGNAVEEHFKATIGFAVGSFTLQEIKSKFYQDYTGYKEGEGACCIGDIQFDEADYKVVGNIYEDPDLLK